MISRCSLSVCRLLIVVVFAMIACSCAQWSRPAETIASEGRDHPPLVEKSFDVPQYTESQLSAYPEEIRDILRRGQLQIALYVEDRYPFFYVDEQGLLQGSDIELARDIASKLGVEAEFVRTAKSFDEVIEQVASGEVDIAISKLSVTFERAKKVLFSNPYLTLKQTLLINRLQLAGLGQGNQDPLGIIQNYGDRIGIVGGTSYAVFARELFPELHQVIFPTAVSLIDAVLKGEVLAAVYDEFEFIKYQKKHPSSSLQLQYLRLEKQNDFIAIAVAPQLYHLYTWINTYLQLQENYVNDLLKNYEIIK